MEKIILNNEKYYRDTELNYGDIIYEYVKDLEDEGELAGSPKQVIAVKRKLGKVIEKFVKDTRAAL